MPPALGRSAALLQVAAVASLVAMVGLPAPVSAQPVPAQLLSVPSEYVGDLHPPGESEFLRPTALFVDRRHHEVLIADSGHNRIVIFGDDGTYRFEFSGADTFAIPMCVAVDANGFIYVVGSTRDGQRLFRFDFDGLLLGEVPIDRQGARLDIRGVRIAEDGRIFVLDQTSKRMLVVDADGRALDSFGVVDALDDKARRETVLGEMTLEGEQLFVPVSTLGTINVFTLDGAFVRSLGHKGNDIGELNFPVAVSVTPDGIVLALDKHRYNVQCRDLDGTFLGEFGGRGSSPGWFYHPSLLGVDLQQQVYVGQVFQNKVQIVRLPAFIRERHDRLHRAPAGGSSPPVR